MAKTNQVFFSRVIIVLLIIVLALFVMGIIREYAKKIELNKEVVTLEEEVEKLNYEKNDFLQTIDAYEGEFFLEQEAREKFNMKKEGESVAVIPVTGSLTEEIKQKYLVEKLAPTFEPAYWQNVKSWYEYFFINNEESI